MRARIVSGHLTESGQFFQKCRNSTPLKMRACGTGRKFAEYDQRDNCTRKSAMERIPLHSWEMEFSIQYHVTINSQLNDQNSIRYYIISNINFLHDQK